MAGPGALSTLTEPAVVPGLSVLDAIADAQLFAPLFEPAESWGAWRVFLKAAFALPMEDAELAVYRAATGRAAPPVTPPREVWTICGRRSGKSRIGALLAAHAACFVDYRPLLAAGEEAVIPVLASDRAQARTLFRYIRGLVRAVPLLEQLVTSETAESLSLSTGATVEVHTSSFKSVRGRSFALALLDEAAFWRSESSTNPAAEVVVAIRPALATMPGARLIGLTTPYARRGVTWDMFRQHYGQDSDVLIWQAPTALMNPTVDEGVIRTALADDESAARSEWFAEFRTDLESYIDASVVGPLVVPGRHELPPTWHARHCAFTDPAGGSGADAMTVAIAHWDPRAGKAVLDLLVERRPPFRPDEVTQEFAAILQRYGIRSVTGDRYAGDWPKARFAAHQIRYLPSELTKSQLYGELSPLLNSAQVELLDHKRLVAQLLGLERRTSWGGRDSIDHGPGGHDDCANAAAGALLLAAAGARRRLGLAALLKREITVTSRPSEPSPDPSPRSTAEVLRRQF